MRKQQCRKLAATKRDFLLNWEAEGFDTAYANYITLNQARINDLRESVNVLITRNVSQGHEQHGAEELQGVLEAANAYEELFGHVLDDLQERGAEESGLIGTLLESLDGIDETSETLENAEIEAAVLHVVEQVAFYLFDGEQEHIDHFYTAIDDLKSVVLAAQLDSIDQNNMIEQIDSISAGFNELVVLDAEVAEEIAAFNSIAESITPVLNEVIEIAESEATEIQADYVRFAQVSRVSQIIFLIASMIAGIALAIIIRRSITLPLDEVANMASALRAGDLNQRVQSPTQDEVGALARTFNQMAEQISDMVSGLEVNVAVRTAQLATTVEVGTLIANIQSQEEMLPKVVELIRDRFGLYYAQVYLLDEAGRYANLRAGSGEVGQQLLGRQHRLDLGATSIVARAVQTGTPVLVEDTRADETHLPNPLLPDTHSEVAIPLIVGNVTLGVLDMQAVEAHTFNSENLSVFQAMANQLAAALQGAEAFDEAQYAIERAEAINRRITGEQWGGYLGQAAHQRLGYQYDLETPTPLEESLEILADNHNQFKHAIALRGATIGTILVQEDHEREWSQEERMLIEDVSERVALAAEQFRAYDQTQTALDETEEQARMLRILNEMGSDLNRVTEENQIYQVVSNKLRDIFHVARASVTLANEEGTELTVYALDGESGAIPLNQVLPVEGTAVGVCYRTGQVTVNNNGGETDFKDLQMLSQKGVMSTINAPLVVGNRIIGTLNLGSGEVGAFTPQHEVVLGQTASLTATALENQRLLEEITLRATELEIVAQVSTEASTNLEVDLLLQDVADLTKERFNRYHAHIYVYDADSDSLVLSAGAGDAGRQMVAEGHSIPLSSERSLVARAARQREGVISNDTLADPDFLANPLLPDTKAEMALPMIVGNAVIGVLDIQDNKPDAFSEEQRQIKQVMANQIGSAVENARAFTQVQEAQQETTRRASELQIVAQVSAEATTNLNIDLLLQDVADLTKERFNRYHAQIYLFDEEARALVLAAGAGDVGRQLVGEGHRIPYDREDSIVATAARNRKGTIVNNVTTEPQSLTQSTPA